MNEKNINEKIGNKLNKQLVEKLDEDVIDEVWECHKNKPCVQYCNSSKNKHQCGNFNKKVQS